jgi:site-specific recombinase XerD
MASQIKLTRGDLSRQFDSHNAYPSGATIHDNFREDNHAPSPWITGVDRPMLRHLEVQAAFPTSELPCSVREGQSDYSEMSLAEFVQHKFIPEFVATKKYAGRTHFRAILKYVLTPERVTRAFALNSEKANLKLKSIQGWPYMDSMWLCEITAERIQNLISTLLQSGYSVQTVTHVRNVIRSIFSHAIVACCYKGTNPALLVNLPAMAHKKARSLTLNELTQIMKTMRYPEKGIALLGLLTQMNIAEICGLQWKCVNLSNVNCTLDKEWIPSKTIAVRTQWYRGEFGLVRGKRKRLISVSDLLSSILFELRRREHFTGQQDFVLASQSGTPLWPENIARRRLKSIGKELEMPWLSWNVFHRTHIALGAEFGRHLHREYERALPLHNLATRYWPTNSGRAQSKLDAKQHR